jgi:hypothetical protein
MSNSRVERTPLAVVRSTQAISALLHMTLISPAALRIHSRKKPCHCGESATAGVEDEVLAIIRQEFNTDFLMKSRTSQASQRGRLVGVVSHTPRNSTAGNREPKLIERVVVLWLQSCAHVLIEEVVVSEMSGFCMLLIGGRNLAYSGTGAPCGVSEVVREKIGFWKTGTSWPNLLPPRLIDGGCPRDNEGSLCSTDLDKEARRKHRPSHLHHCGRGPSSLTMCASL